MAFISLFNLAIISLSFIDASNANGLYSKGSSVLQIDGKSYDRLIAKSGKTSVSIYQGWVFSTTNVTY